jgi:Tol biopolymer transport system component
MRSRRTFALVPLAATAALLASAAPTQATYAGHNGDIAFHSITDSGAQIFSVRPNGHGLRQLTHVDGDAVMPDWSPDGKQIAFEVDTQETADVALMNADGSGLVTIQGVGLFNGDPSFTPDGKRLVYGFFDGERGGVASMTLDGGDQRIIQYNDAEDPNVSPDGSTISLTCIKEPLVLHALCTIPVTGGAETLLTPFTTEVGAKDDWAPDGRQLLFTDHADRPNPGDSANVGVVGADGTGQALLTHFSGGETNAFAGSYSPDGRWIVFRLEDDGRFGLYKIHPDGTRMRAILPLSDFAARFIDWGPRVADD